LTGICWGKWPLSSSESLDVTPAMPASPPEKPTHPFGFPHRPYGRFQASWNFVQSWFLIDRTWVRSIPSKKLTGLHSSSSILTILPDTSNRSIQNVLGIYSSLYNRRHYWPLQYEI